MECNCAEGLYFSAFHLITKCFSYMSFHNYVTSVLQFDSASSALVQVAIAVS